MEDLLEKIKDTDLYSKIKFIEDLYIELNKREDVFTNEFNIHCKMGCGSCCEHFNPDITDLEALYLAYGIIKDDRVGEITELLNNIKDDSVCPLYDKNNINAHCMIYKYRPLICRLFNASVSKDKNGNPIFRKCKWNELECEPSTADFLKHNSDLVLMSDYGERIENEEAGDNNTDLLSIKLLKALDKLGLLLELIDESK